MYRDNVVDAPESYVVSYFGDNITSGSVTVNVTMATIDLPAVDSDVNFFVTAMNVFGTGGNSEILMDDISELTTYVHMYVVNLSTYVCTYIVFITGICRIHGIFGGGFNLVVWQITLYRQIKCTPFRL